MQNTIARTKRPVIKKEYMDIDHVFKNNGDFRGKRPSVNQKSIFNNKTKHCDICKSGPSQTENSIYWIKIEIMLMVITVIINPNTIQWTKTENLNDKKEISNVEQIENPERYEFFFEELKKITIKN